MKGRPYTDDDIAWVREHSHLTPSAIGQHFGATPAVGMKLLKRSKLPTPGDYQDRGAPACLVAGFDRMGFPYIAGLAEDIRTAGIAARAMRNRKAVVYVRLDLTQGE